MVYIICPKSLVSWSVNREGDLTEGTKILAPSITHESQSPFSHHVHDAQIVLLDCTITVFFLRHEIRCNEFAVVAVTRSYLVGILITLPDIMSFFFVILLALSILIFGTS